MRENSPQTPLSEFLRFGAAGAGGAVTEPFAIAEKFPSPLVQVHYARGCTLAEAFYQSIHSPYQLLIVGDPLCRPWAVPPEVSVSGVTSRQTIRGAVTLHPAAKLPDNQQVQSFSLYVDSHLAAECKPNGTLKLDTTPFGDGYHELRVVAVGPEPIESQGRFALPVQFDNRNRKITASLVDQGPIKWDATARIAAHSPGSVGIVAIQGSRIVANMPGDRGQLEIPAKNLGAGPVLLRIMGLGDGGVETTVTAQPLEFTVELRIEEPAKTAN